MSRRTAENSGSTKRIVANIVGAALAIIGVILFGVGFVNFAQAGMAAVQGVGLGGSFGMPSEVMNAFSTVAIGMALMIPGFLILYLVNIRRIFGFYASAATPAIKTAVKAAAEELREEGVTSGGRVRIRCRDCGALNDEDDDYCGKCGRRL
ncbi:MAG: hypothetical protein WED05_03190 [Candidatus Atabeyarchaeum deiterrae]